MSKWNEFTTKSLHLVVVLHDYTQEIKANFGLRKVILLFQEWYLS